VANYKDLHDLIRALREALTETMVEAEDQGLDVVWSYLYDAENKIDEAVDFIPTED
jgi:hypothetical protein